MKSLHPAAAYLKQYAAIKKQIEALEEERARLREITTRAGQNWSGAAQKRSGKHNAFDNVSIKISDIDYRVLRMIDNLRECLEMRLWLLDQMEDQEQRMILVYRYINGLSWEEIMHKIHFESTRTYELHGRALDSFWDIYQKGGIQNDEQHKQNRNE